MPDSNSRVDDNLMGRAKGASHRVRAATTRRIRRRQALHAIERLPSSVHSGARWLVTREATGSERELASSIESVRYGIASLGDTEIRSLSSPVPGSFNRDSGTASTGPMTAASASAHSRTGSSASKGILLKRLAEGIEATSILELGSNTGMSASYLASSAYCGALVTVEGSEDLAQIAQRTVDRFSDRATVKRMLFDEALNELVASGRLFGFAFLDGQHEPEATMYYTRRLTELLHPGGMIVLDDIYWSKGMNEAWRMLKDAHRFASSVDFGTVGVLITEGGPIEDSGSHDFAKFLGRPRIPSRIGD